MDREQRKLMRIRGAGSRPLSNIQVPVLKFPSPKKQKNSPIKRKKSLSPKKHLQKSPEDFRVPKFRPPLKYKAKIGETPARSQSKQPQELLKTTPLRQISSNNHVTPFVLNSVERRELDDIAMDFQNDTDRVPSPQRNMTHDNDDIKESDKSLSTSKKRIRHENSVSPIKKRTFKARNDHSKSKKRSETNTRTRSKSIPKSFKDEYVYESDSTSSSSNGDMDQSDTEFQEENPTEHSENDTDISDADDILYNDRKKNVIKISRMPTSSARLNFIDVLIHYIKESVPQYKHYDKNPELYKRFRDTVIAELETILDLTLTNNNYLAELRNIRNDKNDLRRQILEITNQSNELTAEINKMRAQYRVMKRNMNSLEEIDNYVEKLRNKQNQNENENNIDFNVSDDSETDDEEIDKERVKFLLEVNKLNSVIDPNYGLLEKIKRVNKKLQTIDQIVSRL